MTFVTRPPMKLHKMREVYWLEASANASRVIENVMPIMDYGFAQLELPANNHVSQRLFIKMLER